MAASPAKPLEGIYVLDMTRLLPGAVCTLHLADMGADVIKVEDPHQGDYARRLGDTRKTTSSYFLAVNRNKRSIKLDLKCDQGRQVFLDLAQRADVVIEGFRPGVVDRLEVGYEAVRAVNPRIVYCSLSGFGQTGPYRDRAGHDINYCAYAGITDQIGVRGGGPALANFQIADLAGGSLSAAMGILAALLDAQRTGRGRHVDISMTDCALAHAVVPLMAVAANGAPNPRGEDYLTGGTPGYGVYETEDHRFMGVGALEEKFWQVFCEALERPDLKSRYGTTGTAAVAVRTEIAEVFKTRSQAFWVERFGEFDCCVAPVLTLSEAMDNEQLQARAMFVTVDDPHEGPTLQYAFPIKMSEFEFVIYRNAPGHGEHSHEVLAEIGYSAETIASLSEGGVI